MKSTQKNEFWSALLEKAYVKYVQFEGPLVSFMHLLVFVQHVCFTSVMFALNSYCLGVCMRVFLIEECNPIQARILVNSSNSSWRVKIKETSIQFLL